MSKRNSWIVLISLFVIGCKKSKSEDPFIAAHRFCDCINEKLKSDNLVDLNECDNEVFKTSRLLTIYKVDDKSSYSQATIDSASNFAISYRNITDTMCLAKIPLARINKHKHIKM
jgi:hypothetical protein